MRTLRIALLATAAVAALSSATMAADLILDPPISDEPVIDNSFSWDGAYIGGQLSLQDVPATGGAGIVVGVNGTSDAFLFGAELEGNWLFDGTWSAELNGRVGALVTDTVAVYGFSGIGTHSDNDTYIPLGVGAEFALADNLSLKTEYQYNWDLDNAAEDANVFKAGLNWHF